MRARTLDDPAWHAHVTKLLGPPQEIDLDEVLKRRKAQQKSVRFKIVPNDEQCRYLWKLYSATDDKKTAVQQQQHITTSKDELGVKSVPEEYSTTKGSKQSGSGSAIMSDVRSASTREPLESSNNNNKASTTKEATRSTPTLSKAALASKSVVNKTSSSIKRRRATTASNDGGGWISRSTFYNDEVRRSKNTRQTDDFMEKDYNTINNTTRSSCGTSVAAKQSANQGESASSNVENDSGVDLKLETKGLGARLKEGGASVKQERSDDEKVGAKRLKRQKKRLFRPTAKRADKRLKQKSLKQCFGA